MEQGTSKPTVHPVKLLARACGVLPERKAAGGAGGRPPGQPVSG
jgi:hypothetical protein